MNTHVTILCDNCISASGFLGEHGFSALIERGRKRYLLDTGPGLSLALNLKTLGKELTGLSRVFISHGHYDHTSGLKWVLEQTGGLEIVAHPDIFARHMADPGSGDAPLRFVGCPFTKSELEDLGAVFRFIDRPTEVEPGVWFIAGIPRNPEFVPRDGRLVLQREGKSVTDPISDDATLLLETDADPVLLLGCAHAGVLNILEFVRTDMGIKRLKAVLGGTHLMFYGTENLSRVIEALERFSVDIVAVSHCTGFEASAKLAMHFGARFAQAGAGRRFEY
ncbi:MAG: MBL fold metallo-hydrolase [Deltaproteobacteria bacterium]|nr:MBL fold metallo-hydrolase [Deltaproteobacteria bacterium]